MKENLTNILSNMINNLQLLEIADLVTENANLLIAIMATSILLEIPTEGLTLFTKKSTSYTQS